MFAIGTWGQRETMKRRLKRGGLTNTQAHSCWKWETVVFAQTPSFEVNGDWKREDIRTELQLVLSSPPHHSEVFLSSADPGGAIQAIISFSLDCFNSTGRLLSQSDITFTMTKHVKAKTETLVSVHSFRVDFWLVIEIIISSSYLTMCTSVTCRESYAVTNRSHTVILGGSRQLSLQTHYTCWAPQLATSWWNI